MYLGHGVPADCSVVYGPIWLKLGWMVGWVMITIATSWRPNRPTGGAAGVQKVLFLSSLALNEQATRAMGRWRLSACVILCKQCLPKVLNERATRAMGRWRLSACVILRSGPRTFS